MNKLILVMMYVLWAVSLIGILIITFQNFEYSDLNLIVGVIFVFTLINTFFTIKEKK